MLIDFEKMGKSAKIPFYILFPGCLWAEISCEILAEGGMMLYSLL